VGVFVIGIGSWEWRYQVGDFATAFVSRYTRRMLSDRVQRHIDRLWDQAEEAIALRQPLTPGMGTGQLRDSISVTTLLAG
jgi:hypothetical protein